MSLGLASREPMLTVAYDVSAYAQSPLGGIAQVCYNTLLEASKDNRIKATAFYRRIDSSADRKVGNIPLKRLTPLSRWGLKKFNIRHSLCHRSFPVRADKYVYTVHDIWSLAPNQYQPDRFQQKAGARMRRDIVAADLIITSSEYTRSKLIETGLVSSDKCRNIYFGTNDRWEGTDNNSSEVIDDITAKPYVLFVGCFEIRKNITHILDAVKPVPNLHLVLVGLPGYGYDEKIKNKIMAFPNDRLHLLGGMGRKNLARLYKNAVATLLPSWEEGFGLPILEAMSMSCPMITSNRSANAEIAGDGAILIDPSDPNQSRLAIKRLLEDKPFRKQMIEAGLKRAGQFSWTKYSEELTEIYQSLL